MALEIPGKGIFTGEGFRPFLQAPPLVDQAAEAARIRSRIGKHIDGIEIANNDIIVGKYIPEMIGRLLASAETQKEQRWQNKVGLVLKYGPQAKRDGFLYEVDDWVYYRPNDGQEFGIRCEGSHDVVIALILSPVHIVGRLVNPDLIW